MSLSLLSNLFLALVGIMAILVLGLFVRYLNGRNRIAASGVFLGWLLFVGVVGYRGILASKAPPGLAFVLVPVLLFLLAFLVRSPGVKAFASRVPVEALIGIQVFRVFVELALLELYLDGLIPRLMSVEGGNADILIGISAPIVAWLYARRLVGDTTIRIWCVLGLITLLNIMGRAVLTASGVLKTEVPNAGIAMFPFTFLPGFLAPLALYLHVLLLRSLPRKVQPGLVMPIRKRVR